MACLSVLVCSIQKRFIFSSRNNSFDLFWIHPKRWRGPLNPGLFYTSLSYFVMQKLYGLFRTNLFWLQTLRGQIQNIWKMRNLSILFIDPYQIWQIKSAFSAIQGFDWVLVSRVVCIVTIGTISQLRALKRLHKSSSELKPSKNCQKIILEFFRFNTF